MATKKPEDNDEYYNLGSDVDSAISDCLNYDKIKSSLLQSNNQEDITKSYFKIGIIQIYFSLSITTI